MSSGGYLGGLSETKISKKRRHVVPFKHAAKTVARFLGVGVLGFSAVTLGLYDIKMLGYVLGGLGLLFAMVLFVQHCTPMD